jgi:hypothetical protein
MLIVQDGMFPRVIILGTCLMNETKCKQKLDVMLLLLYGF